MVLGSLEQLSTWKISLASLVCQPRHDHFNGDFPLQDTAFKLDGRLAIGDKDRRLSTDDWCTPAATPAAGAAEGKPPAQVSGGAMSRDRGPSTEAACVTVTTCPGSTALGLCSLPARVAELPPVFAAISRHCQAEGEGRVAERRESPPLSIRKTLSPKKPLSGQRAAQARVAELCAHTACAAS